MRARIHRFSRPWLWILILVIGAVVVISCKPALTPRQGWDKSFGPVVPHDQFPADCTLCHTGKNWTTIRADFVFDHDAKTHFPLRGAHQQVTCLMCHNDRGPAEVFAAHGCGGCHQDPHRATLGQICSDCHDEQAWPPKNAIAKHNQTRFPLTGAHASAACFACHPGAGEQLCRPGHLLRMVSPTRSCARGFSRSFRAGLDERLPEVPRPHGLAAVLLQTQPRVSSHRRTWWAQVSAMSSRDGVHRPLHRMRQLPPGRFPEDHRAKPCPSRLQYRLRPLPHNPKLAQCAIRRYCSAKTE